MIRVNLLVEGKSEQTFIMDLLYHAFINKGIHLSTQNAGGLIKYSEFKKQLQIWIKSAEAEGVYFSTMIDFYGLGRIKDGFPGYEQAKLLQDPYQRIRAVEDAFAADINYQKFIPYIQLHEFETLLFSDIDSMKDYVEDASLVDRIKLSVNDMLHPELINDGVLTAPSKRILAQIPNYDKPVAGTIVAMKIGLQKIRAACPHFNEWIEKLEKLAPG